MIELPDGRRVHNVISSFTEEGYERYGKVFVDSFLERWPKTARLTVFYEGKDFPFTPGMCWIPIEEVEHLVGFFKALNFPLMHGLVNDKYNIQFDARMARKAFMQMHAMKQWGGKVFWLDADTFTHADVPESFLDEMLPAGKFCCYLGRDDWCYTESGFIGFNAEHERAKRFYSNYVNIFLSGVIFTQPGWHDCYGFDAVRKIVGNGPEFVNLAAGLPYGTMAPFVNTSLGRYMDHRKGQRKGAESPLDDLVVMRDEPYWVRQSEPTPHAKLATA